MNSRRSRNIPTPSAGVGGPTTPSSRACTNTLIWPSTCSRPAASTWPRIVPTTTAQAAQNANTISTWTLLRRTWNTGTSTTKRRRRKGRSSIT